MVSGMILAFERPIKIGDTVQVGELMGVIQSIGFRASTVKSFDDSEVIVPNGNLISNSMINWTRSDYNRRMDIEIPFPQRDLHIRSDETSTKDP